jgi:predicted dehydrogenase
VNRLGTALVGCGRMGRRHLRAYAALRAAGLDRFSIDAVCDARPEAVEQGADLAAELLGKRPAMFDDHEALIASGSVEALDVVTDPATHHLVVCPALRAGLHVICEKPLGLTVRACQEMVDAADASGSVLATAENYRRDGPNRLAKAVIDSGLLGRLHLMIEHNVGGSDAVIITPWRHKAEGGPIALDMGCHYADIVRFYLGELESAYGASFIAEPLRRLDPSSAQPAGESAPDGFIEATGDDSLVAVLRARSGVLVQLAYLPSGPGRQYVQRSLHGSAGSMTVPRDRTGGPVVVQLADRTLSGAELRSRIGGFRLTDAAARFLGPDGTEYDLAFAEIDAATIGIELDDFALAISEHRAPEVDGRGGLLAVATVWAIAESQAAGRAVRIAEVADGTLAAAQRDVDLALGFPTTPVPEGTVPGDQPRASARRATGTRSRAGASAGRAAGSKPKGRA